MMEAKPCPFCGNDWFSFNPKEDWGCTTLFGHKIDYGCSEEDCAGNARTYVEYRGRSHNDKDLYEHLRKTEEMLIKRWNKRVGDGLNDE